MWELDLIEDIREFLSECSLEIEEPLRKPSTKL